MFLTSIFSFFTSAIIYPLIIPGLVIGIIMVLCGMLIPRFVGIKLPLTAGGLLVIVFFVFFAGSHSESIKWKEEVARQQLEISRLNVASGESTIKTVTQYVDRVKIVEKVRKEFVNVYVDKIITPKIDLAFGDLPVAFTRLHDSAVKGVIPDPAGDSDALSSGIKLSSATKVITDNYQICRLNSEQLISLQDWIRGQEAVFNK
jgi:hypothetical protein